MSNSRNDLEIVISRVDDICKFLNNLKKSNKSTKDRIELVESLCKKLEENYGVMQEKNEEKKNNIETDTRLEHIMKRLENVENMAVQNIEKKLNYKSEVNSAVIKDRHDKNPDLEINVKKIQSESIDLQKRYTQS